MVLCRCSGKMNHMGERQTKYSPLKAWDATRLCYLRHYLAGTCKSTETIEWLVHNFAEDLGEDTGNVEYGSHGE